ncbi:MAG: ATP-binding protein [Pseudomonadota bacterium]|nr:ATP-binding protein [Pseudomonadota bacterium]
MRISLKLKTILGVALIEATLLALLLTTTFNLLTNLVNDAVVKRANTTANLFYSTTKNAFLSFDLAGIEADVNELLTDSDIHYVKITDTSGRVFASGGNEQSLNSDFQADTSVSLASDGIYDIRRPIMVDDTLYGYIDLGIDIASVKASLSDIQQWAYTIAVIEMVLVALFSYFLGSYLTKQINILQQGARRLIQASKENKYEDIKVNVRTNDELEELATVFNHLISHLEEEHIRRAEAESAIHNLNQSLEYRVRERTNELNRKNEELSQSNKSLKETQQQLLQAEKMSSVGQLAAGVAHEINNPVGFVSSNLDTLKAYLASFEILYRDLMEVTQAPANEVALEKLAALKNSQAYKSMDFISNDVSHLIKESEHGLQRVEEIVSSLKQFSRIDTDQKQLFDLNNCVKTTLALVNNKLKYACDVDINYDELPRVMMNVGKISQVITNLLINAAQAIEETGRRGKLEVRTRANSNGTVELIVRDNGCGISDENLQKIFNPFFTTKDEDTGTGLGLSISYEIAREHEGMLSVKSELYTGTEFTLTLPVCGAA